MLRAAIHNKAMRNTHEGRTLPTTLIFSSGKVDVMNRSVRVLHVDDEPRFTGLTTTHLQRIDDRYVVETAESVTEGLDRLADGRFDCVVSDYDMPGKNGIDFLEAVRESDPNLPFILFTGKGSEEVASRAISAGVTDYLQKAGTPEQFEELRVCRQHFPGFVLHEDSGWQVLDHCFEDDPLRFEFVFGPVL